ncbi:MAG: ATP-binding cassette domain-containing protein [Hyphomicrobiales bacterium]
MESIEGKIANQNEAPNGASRAIGAIKPIRQQHSTSDTYIQCQNISVEYGFRLLAREWNDIQFDAVRFEDKAYQTFDLTPENLSTLADELRINSEIVSIKPTKLKPSDYPCLVILENNTCIILTAKLDKKYFQITDGSTIEKVKIKEFAKKCEGHIITLRPSDEIKQKNTKKTKQPKTAAESYNVFGAVLGSIFSEHKKLLIQMVFAAIVSNLMLVALPLFIMSIYDRIIPHLAFETLWVLSIGVLIAMAIDLCMKLLRQNLTDAIGLATSVKLQAKLFKHLSRLKFKDVPENAGGLSHSTSEFDNISQLVPQILVSIIVDLPFFAVILLILFHLGNAVIIAPIIGVALIFIIHVFAYLLSRKKAAKATQFAQEKSSHIIETIDLFENIKATAIEDKRLSVWERLIDNAAFAGHEERKYSFFSSQASVVISQVVIVFTLIIGVYQLQGNLITIGGLAASSLLVGRAMAPMSALFGLIVKAYHYRNTSATIEKIFNAPLELAGDLSRIHNNHITGDIDFTNVNFAYNPDDGNVLEGLNIKIKHGEKVGIVGRVGCGKSTLMRMAVRYYEADQGRIMLDGHDIRQYSPSDMRKSLIYMSQNYDLFNDTLYKNICNGVDKIDDELFARIVQMTGIHDFVSKQSDGYSMSVGANGDRLSGGQKQSVALAKCLLRQPKVYLLDEPTSALDNQLESVVVRNLPSFIGDNTLIVATHRAPILGLVDRIIWMEDGRVKLDGPKDIVMHAIKTGQMPNTKEQAS